MGKKLRVAAVHYLNTKPLLLGMELSGFRTSIDLVLTDPKSCAELMYKGDVEIALLPVVASMDFPQVYYVSDFGIGCDGPVASVCLYSHVPIEQIKAIYLDPHSRTSNSLLKLICRQHWNTRVPLLSTPPSNGIDPQQIGHLLIGDKALKQKGNFPYCYDLGSAWNEFANLPFVFARWMARSAMPDLDPVLNDSFKIGIKHIDDLIKREKPKYPGIDITTYLTRNIQYEMTPNHNKGQSVFLEEIDAFYGIA